MTTAFLFGGQGSQSAGMGDELCRRSPAAQKVFDEAAAAADFPLVRLMAEGSAEELRRTEVAQPALLTVAVAQARELLEHGIVPSFAMGHSVGQYSALVVADALDFAAAVRLVTQRGRLMQEAVPEGRGAMAAIVGIGRDEVARACAAARSHGVVEVACHNTIGQTVISGAPEAVEAAASALEEEGAGVVPLEVSAPFHCRLLAPMQGAFRDCLDRVALRAPRIPVVDNVTARPLGDATEVRESLVAQITAPVLFEESLGWLAEQGVERCIQCGPGKQLLGFARRITRNARLETFDEVVGAASPA